MRSTLPLLLLLALATSSQAQLVPQGPIRPVNTFTPGSPLGVHLGSNGQARLVITWTSPPPLPGEFTPQDGDASAVVARRFDAAGNPLGPEIVVNTSNAGYQHGSSVAVAEDGRFVIGWTDNETVFFQRFDAAGNRIGGETVAFFAVAGGHASGRITGNAAGDFALGVIETPPDARTSVLARFYDADGTALASHMLAESCPQYGCDLGAITTLASGEYVVAWSDNRFPFNQPRIFARVFSAQGEVLRDLDLFPEGNATIGDLRLAPTPDGGLVVAWTALDLVFTGREDVFVQRFDAGGAPTGPTVPVRAGFGGLDQRFADDPVAVVLEDGSFLVGWWETDYTLLPDRYIFRQRARWFDAESRPLGDDFDLDGAGAPDDLYTSFTALPGNRLAASWVIGWELGPSLDGDKGSVVVRTFSAPRRGGHVCALESRRLRCDLDGDGSFDFERPLGAAFTGTPLFGNLNGDGRPDFCAVSGNRFRCDFGDGGAPELDLTFGPTVAGATPLLANPNGDGRDDLGVVRGRLFAFDTARNGDRAEVKIRLDVQSGDVALAGDLDGDGDDDPCVARDTRFLCDLSHDGSIDLTLSFGAGVAGGDQPLLGDVDGNGSDDPCILRAGHLLCDTAHDGGAAEVDLTIPSGATSVVLGNPIRN